MSNEEARLQRALRDAETDRDNERRRAEVAESKAREAEARVRNLEDQLVAQTERADEMQEELDRRAAAAPAASTPRERDTLVWAAAYGAAFVRSYEDGYSVQDGTPAQRRAAALRSYDAEALTQIADGAVMALHGEAPAEPTPRTKEPGWRSP